MDYESDSEDSESSSDASSSSGSEYQGDSDGNDSDANDTMEAANDGVEDDEQSEGAVGNEESTSESDDDEIFYSLVDNAPVSNHLVIMLGQLVYEGHDVRRAGHSFLSGSFTETWLFNAPKAR